MRICKKDQAGEVSEKARLADFLDAEGRGRVPCSLPEFHIRSTCQISRFWRTFSSALIGIAPLLSTTQDSGSPRRHVVFAGVRDEAEPAFYLCFDKYVRYSSVSGEDPKTCLRHPPLLQCALKMRMSCEVGDLSSRFGYGEPEQQALRREGRTKEGPPPVQTADPLRPSVGDRSTGPSHLSRAAPLIGFSD